MPKRSLILAGGGLKVCYQAGVLQVWLDEAGLTFDHADGASGGTLNLSMYAQGMTGTKIADNWRNLDPFLPADLNNAGVWPFSRSLFEMDAFRTKVFPFWGLDWNKVKQSTKNCTFNLFNFSKKQLETIPASKMSEDHQAAAVSLPMWFPPVNINGDTYFDAVYITDGNLEEAIRQGADELWAIWTVSRKNEWRDGFVNIYFQTIETVADTNFFAYWRRIEESNRRIAAGQQGEFGREIKLNLIEAEVPVHYLLNYSRDRMAEAVNQGVADARAWCKARNIPLQQGAAMPAPAAVTSLKFTEEMKGHIKLGAKATTHVEFQTAEQQGKQANAPFMFHLDVSVPDVDSFVTSPAHESRADGYIDSPLFGGKRTVENGMVNLFVNAQDPSKKNMRYRLFFTGADNKNYTMVGQKDIEGPSMTALWNETTTLYTQILEGHVADGQTGTVLGAGITHILPQDFFFKQMFSFRTKGPNIGARTAALNRFGTFFLGKVWDVYGPAGAF